jgi:hypothetical protein
MLPAKATRIFPQVDEDFLNSVFGIDYRGGESTGQRPHEPAISVDTFIDRPGITVGNAC